MSVILYLPPVILLLTLEQAWGQQNDVFTTCPDVYTVGQLAPIKCTVDSAKVAAAHCTVPAANVQFYLSENGSEKPVCSATYSASTCTQASGSSKCRCMKKEGYTFTYEYDFVPKSTDESEKLRCEVDCLDAQNLTQGPACAPITFNQTTTQSEQSTPVQTTTQSEQSTPGTAGGTGSLSIGQIVGIVVSVIAAVFVAAANAT